VALAEEMLSGSNAAFNMYPGLAYGAAEVIGALRHRRAEAQVRGRDDGRASGAARCASPSRTPGSTSGMAARRAKNADGTYNIKGTKIYISGGDHDLAENIIHLVLARIDGAPPAPRACRSSSSRACG
jgi:alkylation response protein AidB-like acyl-CoA dehydrogenase